MYLKKKDFYILEEVTNILQNIKNTNEDMLSIKDIDTINKASNIITLLNNKNKPREDKKRTKPFVIEEKHLKYLDSVREELVKAEKTIDNIKQDGRWKKAYDYMGTMYNRSKLKNRPTEKNGYEYEVNDKYINHISLSHKYVDYFNENKVEFLQAKKTVDRIKKSNEWKKSFGYFMTLNRRKLLECSPTKENGYTVKVKDFTDDIEQ